MFFFFPLLFLFFCSVIMRRHLDNWRSALLASAIITATALTAITESLSLLKSLSFYPLMICWLLLAAGAGLKVFSPGRITIAWPEVNFKTWLLSEKIFLGIIVFICAVTALTAAVGMPNTWDSMTYHLARVEHWIQNKTVGFYPTNIIRQLYITPWAEFAIAHVRILGGGESSANFIQWTAMVGSLMGCTLIAGQLGAKRTGQLMAATAAACVPMGILQAVSTQTDYVCAFWLIAFVYFLIEARRTPSFVYTTAAGLSMGVALLTKAGSYIFAVPFLIWFVGANFKKRFVQSLLGLLLMIIFTAGLNMGQYLRNTQTFGSPTWTSASVTNESFDLKVLWVNVLRNIGIHMGTPLRELNKNIEKSITRAAQIFGADLNDPRATLGYSFGINGISFDEDYSGNLFHAIVFVIVFGLSWFYRGPKGRIGFYVLSVASSFLLFCLIVRYQPWHSRFHLPLFILFCPVAGVVLEHFFKKKSIVLAILLFLWSTQWLFLNDQHPWVGRHSIWRQPKPAQYFYKKPYMVLPIVVTTNYLKSIGCTQVGLLLDEDTWEYPWWVFMAGPGVRIEHVGVSNLSTSLKYPLGDFQPCAIVVSGQPAPPLITVGSAVYAPAGAIPAGDNNVTVFLRKI